MTTNRTIATEILKGMIDSLVALGLRPSDMYEATRLSPEILETENGRIPFEVVIEFGLWVRDQRGPAAGILVAEAMATTQHFVLGYVLANSATLGDAFESWVRYRRIAFEGAPFEMTRRGDEVELSATYPEAAATQLPGLIEGYLGYTLAKGRHITGVRWRPNQVLLQGAETNPEIYDKFFQSQVINGAERTAILFPARLLDLPVITADPKLKTYLQTIADDALASLPDHDSFVLEVRAIVMAALKQGHPTLDTAADHLHVSARTLQRRLEKENTSFAEVLDDVRRSAALAYLRDRHVAISEAAYLLGFSEPSTFYRAFKRWTGSTPADYRRRVSISA